MEPVAAVAGWQDYSQALAVVGAIAGGVRSNEVNTMLMLADNLSGVQVSASQGKVIIAAFTGSDNQMVKALHVDNPQTVQGQGVGGGGELSVDGAAAPSQTFVPAEPKPVARPAARRAPAPKP